MLRIIIKTPDIKIRTNQASIFIAGTSLNFIQFIF